MPKELVMVDRIKPARIPIPYEGRKLSASLTVNDLEVRNDVLRLTYHNVVTTGTSYIYATLRNEGAYLDLWKGGEVVKLKADFSNGTTQVFEGFLMTVEPVHDRFPQLRIFAQDYGIEAMNLKITKIIEADTDIGIIFQQLVEQFLPNHTTSNIDTDTGILGRPSWFNHTLWDAFKDLALKYGSNGYDFYVDKDKDWHFFKKGSVQNTAYFATYGGNIRQAPRVTEGISKKKNRVIVYGANQEGIPVFATSENSTDQSTTFIQDEVFTNTNLTTYDQCKSEADLILATKLVTGKSGEIQIAGEINIVAGEEIFISHPYVPMHGFFIVSDIRHEIGRSYLSTIKFYETLPITEGIETMFDKIREREEKEKLVENKFGLKDSIIETFETQLNGSYSNVQASNSRLVLVTGTPGTWISPTLNVPYNASQAYLIVNGSDFEISEFSASSQGGITGSWETITPTTLYNLITQGKQGRLRIILKSDSDHPNPSIESVHLGFK